MTWLWPTTTANFLSSNLLKGHVLAMLSSPHSKKSSAGKAFQRQLSAIMVGNMTVINSKHLHRNGDLQIPLPHFSLSQTTLQNKMNNCKADTTFASTSIPLCANYTDWCRNSKSRRAVVYTQDIKSNLAVRPDNPINIEDRVYKQLMHRQVTQKMYHDWGILPLPPLIEKQCVYVQNDSGKWDKRTVQVMVSMRYPHNKRVS